MSVDSADIEGNNSSATPAISADGRFVTFTSFASNLVAGDTNGTGDVFVHDRDTGTTTRVSVDSAGIQGNGDSGDPAISADGRFVVFTAVASNLVAGDTNGTADVFVHDRDTGATSRVSVDSAGSQVSGPSYLSAISADGRFVAFTSEASNLVAGDTNGTADVFVHDRATGATSRVSVDSAGNEGNDGSAGPAISGDGRFVAFSSVASNLVAGDTNGTTDVFVHDRNTGATSRVSVGSTGIQGNGFSSVSAISTDGRFVAFRSAASNLVAGDTNGKVDAFVRDRDIGTTSRVSVDSTGNEGNDESGGPAISANGRFVTFSSFASNLVAGDTNGSLDVFVHDRDTGATSRVSVDSTGVQGNGNSFFESISADGRFVTFTSHANNLVAGDTNGSGDVFVHDVGPLNPVADAGPDQTVEEGSLGVTLDGSSSSNATSYHWTQLPGGPSVTLSSASAVNPSFDAPYVSSNTTLTFELVVDDGTGNFSAPDTVDITVVSVNNPPVADAGDNDTIKEGAVATLDGGNSFDPEGDSPLGYAWTQIAGPAVTLSDDFVVSPTFTAPLGVGTLLSFELVVDDGKEFSDPDTVDITVVENSTPIADAGPDQTIDEATLVALDGTASSDPDGGDTLSFDWSGPVALSNTTSPTPTFTAPFVNAGGDTLTFTLVVTDDDPVNPKSSTTDAVTVHVQNINDPPSCDLARAACPESKIKNNDDCTLWPPNHKLIPVAIVGVTDVDNNDVTLQITGVTQDEPVNAGGDGDTSPDAVIQVGDPADSALIRAERTGLDGGSQENGRVYVISFIADDGFESCTGAVTVGVPHDRKDVPVDDGQSYDSTLP